MEYIQTEIPDVVVLKPRIFGDDRGFFLETFRQDDFIKNVANYTFVQDNHSMSGKGILRGLHYQLEHTQGKLVRVISGEVLDVAVDMRQGSKTLGQSVVRRLSAENKLQMWVPPGFAHGFLVLSDTAEFVYKCTDYYHPKSEVSLKWDDPTVNIDWGLTELAMTPLLSEKDLNGLSFSECPKF